MGACLLLIGIVSGHVRAEGNVLSLDSKSGKEVLSNYSGQPNKRGIMETYKLVMPDFKQGVYYQGEWWPAGGTRVYPHIISSPTGDEGGIFLLLKLDDGSYLAVLPLNGDHAYSWFHPTGDEFQLRMGTHGHASISGDVLLVTWSRADKPYQACYQAWNIAAEIEQIEGHMKLRSRKDYPEVFRYLGRMSRGEYQDDITSEKMIDAMNTGSESTVPISWYMLDAGHINSSTLGPNQDFPDGYQPITDVRDRRKEIRWLGIWYAFLGRWPGVKAPGNLPERLTKYMYKSNAGKLLPRPGSEEAARAFYNYVFDFTRDFDFVKTDFQTDALPFQTVG